MVGQLPCRHVAELFGNPLARDSARRINQNPAFICGDCLRFRSSDCRLEWKCVQKCVIPQNKSPAKPCALRGFFGADDGNRTHTASLGSWSSTTKLHLHRICNYGTRFSIQHGSLKVKWFFRSMLAKLPEKTYTESTIISTKQEG